MGSTETVRVKVAGTVALVITLLYTTCGLLLQALRIIQTGETPSLAMMAMAALTFASWSVWSWLKVPKEWNVLVSNLCGFCGCALVIGLSLWVLSRS